MFSETPFRFILNTYSIHREVCVLRFWPFQDFQIVCYFLCVCVCVCVCVCFLFVCLFFVVVVVFVFFFMFFLSVLPTYPVTVFLF